MTATWIHFGKKTHYFSVLCIVARTHPKTETAGQNPDVNSGGLVSRKGNGVTAQLSCTGLVPALKTAAHSTLLCCCMRVKGEVQRAAGARAVCVCVRVFTCDREGMNRVELEFSQILQNNRVQGLF